MQPVLISSDLPQVDHDTHKERENEVGSQIVARWHLIEITTDCVSVDEIDSTILMDSLHDMDTRLVWCGRLVCLVSGGLLIDRLACCGRHFGVSKERSSIPRLHNNNFKRK